MATGNRYTAEFKAKVVQAANERTGSLGPIAHKYNISMQSINRWVRQSKTPGGLTDDPRLAESTEPTDVQAVASGAEWSNVDELESYAAGARIVDHLTANDEPPSMISEMVKGLEHENRRYRLVLEAMAEAIRVALP
jgi:transposase-like protein